MQSSRTTIEEIIDRLYRLRPAEFTQARNEAVAELRKAGQRDAAEHVKALRKPTATAATVNRLVREHRDEVEQFLSTAAELGDAQLSGEGDLAAARHREHEALERLASIAGEAVRQTLLAAAVDDGASRQLLEARLERELEPRGFGTLLAHAPTVPAKSGETSSQKEPASPKSARPDDSAARAKVQEARAALRAAETEERQARLRWEQRQSKLEKARAALDKAKRDLDRLHGG